MGDKPWELSHITSAAGGQRLADVSKNVVISLDPSQDNRLKLTLTSQKIATKDQHLTT
jgi:hypothetical protein